MAEIPRHDVQHMSRHVSYEHAQKFLQRCFAKPERMRLLCSTKAERQGQLVREKGFVCWKVVVLWALARLPLKVNITQLSSCME